MFPQLYTPPTSILLLCNSFFKITGLGIPAWLRVEHLTLDPTLDLGLSLSAILGVEIT